MRPFSIIDGLHGLFDTTSSRQVVKHLIRNPLIWDFLSYKENFSHISKTLGNNPTNWSISAIVEAAADIELPNKDHPFIADSINSESFGELVKLDTPIQSLSAIALKINDFAKDGSLGALLEGIQFYQQAENTLYRWSTIFSIIFKTSYNSSNFFSIFSKDDKGSVHILFAYLLYMDAYIADSFLAQLSILVDNENISWLVRVVQYLESLGDTQFASDVANKILENYSPSEKPDITEFSHLLNMINKNRDLIFLAQITGDANRLTEFQNFGKCLIVDFLQETGITNFDNSLLNDFDGYRSEDRGRNEISLALREKIDYALSLKSVDFESARSIALEIANESRSILKEDSIRKLIHYSQKIAIADMLLSMGLVNECAELLDCFIKSKPGDIEILHKKALINHQYGNHISAVESFRVLSEIDSLSREEKIAFIESLSYYGDVKNSFIVRKETNFLCTEDVINLLIDGYHAGYQEELKEILKSNPFNIQTWPLTKYLLNPSALQDLENKDTMEAIWASVKTDNEKYLLIKLLEDNNQCLISRNLLESKVRVGDVFSKLTPILIESYQSANRLSEICEMLQNIQIDQTIGQREFEEWIALLLKYGLVEKANSLLNEYKEFWILSPEKNRLTAKASLYAGDFETAQKIFSDEHPFLTEDEEHLTDYCLALLKSTPDSFPLDVDFRDLSVLQEIKNNLCLYQDYSGSTARIIGIETNGIDKILFLEKEQNSLLETNSNEIWRVKAALANEYFIQQQYDQAIKYYKEVERKLPFNIHLLKKLLESFLRLKLIDESEVILHRLLAVDGLKSLDLINLLPEIPMPQDWFSFLETQVEKFPASYEIKLLFALSSLENRYYAQATEMAKEILKAGDRSFEDQLIAVQILVSAGDIAYAENILNILFSNNQEIEPKYYITAALIYQSIGNISKAIVMINHLQPLDRSLLALKLNLLIKNNQGQEAADIVKEIDQNTLPNQKGKKLALIDQTVWTSIKNDPFYLEKTIVKVLVFNRDLAAAKEFINKNKEILMADEELSLLMLEIVQLQNDTDTLKELSSGINTEECQSDELVCALGEAALMLNEEVQAAKYLSACIEKGIKQPKVIALQARMLKRNGNLIDAKQIYEELIQEMDFDTNNSSVNNIGIMNNKYWLANLAFEMGDFRQALKICEEEIQELGMLPSLANVFIQSLISICRENIIYQSINCGGHLVEISEKEEHLLSQIEFEHMKDSTGLDIPALTTCRAYIHQNQANYEKALENIDTLDLKDKAYLVYQHKGLERMQIEFLGTIKEEKDIIFLAAAMAGEYPEKSLEMIKEIANLSSQNPIHLALLATLYFNLGNLPDAYAAVNLALKIWPNEYGLETLAGKISQETGDMVKAIEHFERARSLSNALTYKNDLDALQILTESEEAIPVLESQLSKNPDNYESVMKLATLYQKYNRPGKAAACYESAIKLDPHNQAPFLGLSRLSRRLGNAERALEYASDGLKLNSQDIDLIILKSDLLKDKFDSQSAILFLENQIQLNSYQKPLLQAALADLIYETEGLDECLSYLSTLTDEKDSSIELINIKVKYYLLAGDFKNADILAHQALGINADNAQTHALLGDLSRSQGDLDQAVSYYLQAIRLDSSNEELFLNLFEIYNDRRDFEEAKGTLEKGILIIPSSIKLRVRLAKYYFQHGLMKKAIEKIEQALRLSPNDDEAKSLQRLFSLHTIPTNTQWELAAE